MAMTLGLMGVQLSQLRGLGAPTGAPMTRAEWEALNARYSAWKKACSEPAGCSAWAGPLPKTWEEQQAINAAAGVTDGIVPGTPMTPTGTQVVPTGTATPVTVQKSTTSVFGLSPTVLIVGVVLIGGALWWWKRG